ncbi:MAG: magnesium transporter [Planctomycetes bacterium]|nr:magnesium transporter [Planctomycetota bacterium]MCB9917856.1 magnesium transporter [Planctomycetota bacterium]
MGTTVSEVTEPISPESSWSTLERLLDRAEQESSPEAREAIMQSVGLFLQSLGPSDTARCFDRLDEDHRNRLLEYLDAESAADLIESLPTVQGTELLEHAAPEKAAAILEELPSDEQADLLTTLEPESFESILAVMDPQVAEATAALAAYPSDTAGGLMVREILAYQQSATAAEVIENLRRRIDEVDDYDVQYIYVTDDDEERLVGVLRLRDLLLARGSRPIRSFMITDPVAIRVDTPLETLVEVFEQRSFLGLPVIDGEQRLLGLVHRDSVDNAFHERDIGAHLREHGIVGGEELRSMPIALRAGRRLSWLSVNIVLNLMAASVIAAYQDTLSAAITLAVFLPIISDMSGCSGNQAVAVSMRELSLGIVKPLDVFYVWRKEIAVGAINGIVLGLLLAGTAWLWKGNPMLGVVVGTALAVNTLVAVSIGGSVPLILKRFGMDPALASGPILTTLTDVCGFFLVLSIASTFMSQLTGT